jgi:hypothetical protein
LESFTRELSELNTEVSSCFRKLVYNLVTTPILTLQNIKTLILQKHYKNLKGKADKKLITKDTGTAKRTPFHRIWPV